MNSKHVGVIERVADGFAILCKGMRKYPNSSLSKIHIRYLRRILTSFEMSDFKNIFRRSSGIPPAIVNLMRVEPVGRIVIIKEVIDRLFLMN